MLHPWKGRMFKLTGSPPKPSSTACGSPSQIMSKPCLDARLCVVVFEYWVQTPDTEGCFAVSKVVARETGSAPGLESPPSPSVSHLG